MSRVLVPARVDRLLPLLGSNNLGEQSNANRAILRDLGSVGLDWCSVVLVPKAVSSAPASSTAAPMPAFFDMARACRDLDCGRLTQPEKKFVGEMCRLGNLPPSPRQAQWLGAIFAKLHRRATA